MIKLNHLWMLTTNYQKLYIFKLFQAQNNFSKNYETIQKNIKLLDDKIKSKK